MYCLVDRLPDDCPLSARRYFGHPPAGSCSLPPADTCRVDLLFGPIAVLSVMTTVVVVVIKKVGSLVVFVVVVAHSNDSSCLFDSCIAGRWRLPFRMLPTTLIGSNAMRACLLYVCNVDRLCEVSLLWWFSRYRRRTNALGPGVNLGGFDGKPFLDATSTFVYLHILSSTCFLGVRIRRRGWEPVRIRFIDKGTSYIYMVME